MRFALPTLITFLGLGLSSAQASELPLLVGDPKSGQKLYAKECASCHGAEADGGKTGISLRDSGRLNLLRNEQLFDMIETGKGLKKPGEHQFKRQIRFLEIWDVVAHVRGQHLVIQTFFPNASRYVAKEYTIDNFGLERIKAATGKPAREKKAAVFTFFNFEGEEGNLSYVPDDPIRLDELKKDKKSGYLVFLPFKTPGFEGELGVAMDKEGVITKLAVHEVDQKTELLNKSLSRFAGLGRKGQKEPFKVAGGKTVSDLAADVFPVYLVAMESATMYDREETERTWADQD